MMCLARKEYYIEDAQTPLTALKETCTYQPAVMLQNVLLLHHRHRTNEQARILSNEDSRSSRFLKSIGFTDGSE